MKKTYIPIVFTFIFSISCVHSSVNASDLIIPENSTCEVRLGKSSSVISEHKESNETAVIICDSKKANNNKFNHLYTNLLRKLAENYYIYNSPNEAKWEITPESIEKRSI